MLTDAIRIFLEKTFLLLGGGDLAVPRIAAAGSVAGQEVATTVDSEAARYYLERRPGEAGAAGDPGLYERVDALRRGPAPAVLSRERLEQVSRELSPDVAALYLTEHVTSNEVNRSFRTLVDEQMAALRSAQVDGGRPPEPAAPFLILFLPGWHYKAFPETGADFARPREILARMGLTAVLVETAENGTVEENALAVAESIRSHSRNAANIMLVSASKSGPEAAQALGAALPADEAAAVKAWVNIGGLLQGTYLCDSALRWPKRVLANLFFAFKGWKTDSLWSMSTARSRDRFLRLRIPPHIVVINYVGIPLSGHVTMRAKNNYRALRRYGPNDGLSLLSDELIPEGITVPELGLDHYYLSPDMDLKAAALAYAVIGYIASRVGR
jgi:hypothetical protein